MPPLRSSRRHRSHGRVLRHADASRPVRRRPRAPAARTTRSMQRTSSIVTRRCAPANQATPIGPNRRSCVRKTSWIVDFRSLMHAHSCAPSLRRRCRTGRASRPRARWQRGVAVCWYRLALSRRCTIRTAGSRWSLRRALRSRGILRKLCPPRRGVARIHHGGDPSIRSSPRRHPDRRQLLLRHEPELIDYAPDRSRSRTLYRAAATGRSPTSISAPRR